MRQPRPQTRDMNVLLVLAVRRNLARRLQEIPKTQNEGTLPSPEDSDRRCVRINTDGVDCQSDSH